MSPFRMILIQSIRLAMRKGGGTAGALGFYLLLMTLFATAMGREVMTTHITALGCVCLLLANMIILPLYFNEDHEDGSLEQLKLSPTSLEWLVGAKILGLWLSCTLPLLVITLVIALILGIPPEKLMAIIRPLLMASPSIFAIGALTSAITLSMARGGFWPTLLAMQLYLPVLYCAVLPAGKSILALGIMLVISLPVSCRLSAKLIRLQKD